MFAEDEIDIIDGKYDQKPKEPGHLTYLGRLSLGVFDSHSYFQCIDCGTIYPVIDGTVRCNGESINFCPCRNRKTHETENSN